MTRRCGFLEPGAVVLTPEQVRMNRAIEGGIDVDRAVLVVDNPWATAAVLVDSWEGLQELQGWIDLLKA